MAQLEVFIFKLVPVDAATASAVTFGKVTTLKHEILDDPVEFTALVTLALRLHGEFDEIPGGFRYGGPEHADYDVMNFTRAMSQIEPYLPKKIVASANVKT